MKVNFEYMAMEDLLNIDLYGDLMCEVDKLEKRCHKIHMVIHNHCSNDELKE